MTWYNAVSYCRWLTNQSGLAESDQCYDDPVALEKNSDGFPKDWPFHPKRRGYRLPTEAEWEFACRAGTVTPFSFGSDRRLLSKYGWFQENSGRNPSGWGKLRPNFFGVFDLYGNAVEWCHDRYIGYDPLPLIDPFGRSREQVPGLSRRGLDRGLAALPLSRPRSRRSDGPCYPWISIGANTS